MSLFDNLPRTPRRVIMHIIDAGGGCGSEPGIQYVRFKCDTCSAETDWEEMPSISAARRGIPCHNCNTNPTNEQEIK